MADEDNDKARKTNADRDFKPANEDRDGQAPRGAVGRPQAGPTPGLGTSSSGRKLDQTARPAQEGHIAFRRGGDQTPPTDDAQPVHDPAKPYAIATDDPAHNKELAKDHNVVSRQAAEQMLGPEKVAGKFYDEPVQDQATADKDVDRGQEKGPSQSNDGPQQSDDNFARALRQAQGPGRTRSRDHDLE